MAYPRRRNNNNNNNNNKNKLRLLIPIISVISAVLLLLFGLLSFFAPSPPDTDHFLHLDHIDIASLSNNEKEDNRLFRVPIHGGKSSSQDLWVSKLSNNFYGCSNSSHKFIKAEFNTHPNRYLVIATSGGLNQQRTGITDAVVAARILNATLVVPKLDQKSFWKDSSNFTEIFDVDWFISTLRKDVKIIKELPKKGGRVMSPYRTRVPRKCTPSCYEKRVLPLLIKKHVVQLSKFDYRLANKLDTDLQKLRCRVNYHALRFTEPIHNMGRRLVQRMRMRSKHFIALHLRFEPDMLAFSGCYYGGGEKEKKDLSVLRRRWKTLHSGNPDKARRQGRCPLTPEEVGLMLRALGYGSDVHIYVASGDVYGGEATLAPLKALFPHFHSKDTITREDELSPFSPFSSRMAALDFIVCDESDVFVTNNNGNMAKILAGRRRYFGHKRTVRPNAKKLNSLFLNRVNMTWEAFASKVRTHQRGLMGEPHEVRPGRGEFHENPSTCICEYAKSNEKDDSSSQSQQSKDTDVGEDLFADDEPDYDESQIGLQDTGFPNITDYTLLRSDEQPELEDMFSD